jgi:hypothetical protein
MAAENNPGNVSTEDTGIPNLADQVGEATKTMTDQDKVNQKAMFERKKALDERTKTIEAAEADLAERERLAGVKAKQLEVDEREDALNKTDKMIETHQAGETAKPGEPFIDKDGIQHKGNCNSHPSKRSRFQCDCGFNGTSRSLKRTQR